MILVILKFISCCLGLFIIYISWFLYEDEEGQIQNRLQDIWLNLSYKEDELIPRLIETFNQEVFHLKSSFDTILGEKLLSFRFIKMSVSASLTSMIFLSIFYNETTKFIDWASHVLEIPWYRFVYLSIIVSGLIGSFTFYSYKPNLKDSQRRFFRHISNLLFFSIFGTLVLSLLQAIFSFGIPLGISSFPFLIVLTIFIFALFFDIVAILFIRYLIKKQKSKYSVAQFLGFFFTNLVILFIALLPILYMEFNTLANDLAAEQKEFLFGLLQFLFLSNFPSLLTASLIFLILFYVLVNKFFMQLAARSVYSIQRYDLLNQKKYIVIIAILLIAWPFGFLEAIWEKIEIGL